MSWKTVVTSVLVLGSLVLSAPVSAQIEDESFAMDEEAMLFEEIPSVFGASKYEQKITEAPSFVSIVTADEIARHGYRTVADILRGSSGFYTSYDRNYEYVGVRGFGIPGDYNSRILLMVDGHRINDGIYGSAGVGTEFLLDVDLIDRVEIVRGPSSSIYGSNAFFGVINVITRRGRDLQGVEVAGSWGTQRARGARLSYGNNYPNGMEVLLSGTVFRSDGDDDLYYPEFDDPLTNDGRAEDSDGDEFGNLFGELSFAGFTLQGAYSKREKEIPTAPWGTYFNSGGDWSTDDYYYLSLAYDHSFADLSNVTAKVSYNRYFYDGEYIYDWDEDPAAPYLATNYDAAEGRWWGVEGQYSRRFLDAHRVSIGAESRNLFQADQWAHDRDDLDGGVEYPYLDSRESSTNWGLYLQDEWTIADSLILNAGVRYDHYDTFGGTTNPRLALIYQPLAQTGIKFLYGQAFRAPNVYELYYNDEDADEQTQKANPDLDPETIRTYELIWEQGIGEHLRSVASGFFYEIDDLIVLATDPDDDLLVFENVEKVETKGVELALHGTWQGGLQAALSYTFQKAEDESSGEWLVNSPKHLGKANLIAPLWSDVLFGGVELQYSSKRRTVGGDTADGYWLTNLTLTGEAELGSWVKGVEVSASVYNLFDETYSHPGSEEHTQDQLEQDGRMFRIKAVARF